MMDRRKTVRFVIAFVIGCISLTGCSRGHYRLRADADAYGRLIEKSIGKPWSVPSDYSVYPAPHSRLYDPTCVNDPMLPVAAPQLYDYDLPELPQRDPGRFRAKANDESAAEILLTPEFEVPDMPDVIGEPDATVEPDAAGPAPLDAPTPASESSLKLAPPRDAAAASNNHEVASKTDRATDRSNPNATDNDNNKVATTKRSSPFRAVALKTSKVAIDSASFYRTAQLNVPPPTPTPDDTVVELAVEPDANALELPPPTPASESDFIASPADNRTVEQSAADTADDNPLEDEYENVQANQVPLPRSYWESIPPECLARMFSFQTVRDEYARTYGNPPDESQMDASPKLTLEDIIDLTLLNSRELQTQKENLYRVALALTLERFDYQLRPSFGNNGTATDYNHIRNNGITRNVLGIPTTLQLEKMMYSGADFIGRFANDVLLTFNGPQGFAVDVSSELLFNFSQSLLQRDVRLEGLTQAERNVVYAARDFTRFRKTLFVQQASDYYSLIRQLRQIEIDSQNYFTLAREFNQRSIEIKFGIAARTQLDQVEQQVISGRQRILSTCTSLENGLDSLKIRMGLPTEQPLNLDLSELDLITLLDELAVTAELIKRTRARIDTEIESESRSAFVIIGGVAQLAEQMLDFLELRRELGEEAMDDDPLANRLLLLRIEAADIDIFEDREVLNEELQDVDPDATKVVQRRRDVSQELLKKLRWQINLLEKREVDSELLDSLVKQYELLGDRLTALETSFLNIIFREQAVDSNADADDIRDAEQQLIEEAAALQEELQAIVDESDLRIGRQTPTDLSQFELRAIGYADELMSVAKQLVTDSAGGLVPIEIDVDDAMMTALVQRFDLMNERGFLADDWRAIKYAGDDLRSILNLNATHAIRTRNGENRPFDFTFDDSNTSVRLSLDLPFNRRDQRNRFRTSLFNYQQTLRNVMALEDNIKLSIRRDLRNLKLDRQQYANGVAGAALASERVTSTELEVRGGFATSRDFLESQTAYVQAISGVASDHINYIVGRLELFLDLESLTVGEDGFWDELYDENFQPEPVYQIPGYGRPPYGELHPRLKYSRKIRRMNCVPDGVSMIHQPSSAVGTSLNDTDSGPTVRQDARQAVQEEWQINGEDPRPAANVPIPPDTKPDGKSAARPAIRLDSLPAVESIQPNANHQRETEVAGRNVYAPIGY